MTDKPAVVELSSPPRFRTGLVAVAMGVALAYCLVFLVRPAPSWPAVVRNAISRPSAAVYGMIDTGCRLSGIEPGHSEVRQGAYLLLMAAVVPWLLMALIGRGRPHDLGFRRPNRFGWRIALIGYLGSWPFLIWMVAGADFAGPYLKQLERAGSTAFVLYYVVNMLTEHFLFHGAILAACRSGHRWPQPAPVVLCGAKPVIRLLRWFGLAHPTEGASGLRGVTRWIGLPDGCVLAILTSAALFGLIHVGKDARELLLSVPGGVVLGYIAFRTNTWLVPFLLHVATAGTACALIILLD